MIKIVESYIKNNSKPIQFVMGTKVRIKRDSLQRGIYIAPVHFWTGMPIIYIICAFIKKTNKLISYNLDNMLFIKLSDE